MDIMRVIGGRAWFEASKVWGMDRAVYYEGDLELVPLLPEEVPFAYDSDEFVYLWDRDTGVAVETSRVAAWAIVREVEEGPSAVALFGECPEENGYSHELITDKVDESGPYPTAGELRGLGVSDVGSGCSMHEVASGLYECRKEPGGKALAQLAHYDVVGGLPVAGGFLPGGINPKAFTATTDMNVFTRMCVVGSEAVDFSVQPRDERLTGSCSQVDLRWFGQRSCAGSVVNMGMVTVGEARNLTDCVEVCVSEMVKRLYYLDLGQDGWFTKAVDVVDGAAMLKVSSKLCGMYVYALTDSPLKGTSDQPVKFTQPLRQLGAVSVAGDCYLPLVADNDSRGTSSLEWAELVQKQLVPLDDMQGLCVVRTGVHSWHVTSGDGLPVSEVVTGLRSALKTGQPGTTVGGQFIPLTDYVGAVSPMIVLLMEHLSTLRGVSKEELDEKGARISGMATALLGVQDKNRCRVLQAVGDNALSLALSVRVLDSGGSAQGYQEMRSASSNNSFLAQKFRESVFFDAFQDVGPSLSPKTGGGAVEAMLGTLYLVRGMAAVVEYMEMLGI